ncbi:hypothetical protein Tco_1303644 [Tanacetum coccineum]
MAGESSSSSPVLMASSSSGKKYIHDYRNRAGLNSKSNGTANTNRPSGHYSYQQPNPQWAQPGFYQSRVAQQPSQPNTYPRFLQHGLLHHTQQPSQAHSPLLAYTFSSQQQHPAQGKLGPAPAQYASHATSIPSAFSTMTLQDPTWHMDTGASSHLNSNAGNLSTILINAYIHLFMLVTVFELEIGIDYAAYYLATSAMVKAQVYVGFVLDSLSKEAQAVTSRNDSLAILECTQFDQTAINHLEMIRRFKG